MIPADADAARADRMFTPISIERAMQITGRSRRTIDRWIKDGRVAAVRLPGSEESVLIERQVAEAEKACRDARAGGRPPRTAPQVA